MLGGSTDVNARAIREAGLKVTRPRVTTLEILGHAESKHLTVEEIHSALSERGQETGLDTITGCLQTWRP